MMMKATRDNGLQECTGINAEVGRSLCHVTTSNRHMTEGGQCIILFMKNPFFMREIR